MDDLHMDLMTRIRWNSTVHESIRAIQHFYCDTKMILEDNGNIRAKDSWRGFLLQHMSILEEKTKIQQLVTALELQFFKRIAESRSSAKVHVLGVFRFVYMCSQCVYRCPSMSNSFTLWLRSDTPRYNILCLPLVFTLFYQKAKPWSFVCLN